MPDFTRMGGAIKGMTIEYVLAEDFPNGLTRESIGEAHPDVDIFDFGENDLSTLNFASSDTLEDRPAGLVFDSDLDGLELVSPEGLKATHLCRRLERFFVHPALRDPLQSTNFRRLSILEFLIR